MGTATEEAQRFHVTVNPIIRIQLIDFSAKQEDACKLLAARNAIRAGLVVPDALTPLAPELEPPQLAPVRKSGSLAWGAGLALLAGFAAYGFVSGATPSKGDRVSNGAATKLAADFGRGKGSLMPVDGLQENRRSQLINAMKLPRNQAVRLLDMVANGERSIGWLTLWDNFDEDGDVVSVTAAGVTQTVALTHAPVRIPIAYVPGQPVYVTGEHDGGGGITVAVELSTGPLPLPLLAVGQTIALPIR